MNQTENIQKSVLQDFSVLSFGSDPNQNEYIEQQQSTNSNNQPYCFTVSFVLLGFYFLIFAIVQLATNFNQTQYKFQLVRNGPNYESKSTFLSFPQNNQIFVYLNIQKISQIDILTNNEVQQNKKCRNFQTNQKMNKIFSINGMTLNPKDNAIPCGKFASFYPEGIFQIIDIDNSKSLSIKTQGISGNLKKLQNISPSLQWANLQDQRFINWMNVDARQKVMKLWGKVPEVLSGNYKIKLTLNNQMPQIQRFIVNLNNNGALGGYNNQLCYVNFLYAIMVFLASLLSFLIQRKCGHKKLLKKKSQNLGGRNQIRILLNSGANTPAAKMH